MPIRSTLVTLVCAFGCAVATAAEPVVDLTGPDRADRWRVVNDNVMGGRSIGGFEFQGEQLVFSGSTNTNGGGFSSIRTWPGELGLEDSDGLAFRVRGDGRTYLATLRTGAAYGRMQISYRAAIPTRDGEWIDVRLPFDRFNATLFGEDISNRAPALQASDITSVGFMIYDKNDGPFRLDVASIEKFDAQPSVPLASGDSIEFDDAREIVSWTTTADDAMGGITTTTFDIDGGRAILAGTISDRFRGRASAYTAATRDVTPGLFNPGDVITMRVRGDGRTYRLIAQTDAPLVEFVGEIQTLDDTWTIVSLDVSQLDAALMGDRSLAPGRTIDPRAIRSIGFNLVDRTPGPFQLEVDWIRVIRD